MATTVDALARYPVKGLSAQKLDSVNLAPGQGFPNDRRFGFARPNSGFDPSNPKPLPKTKFYMLARDATLALLNTSFDDDSNVLTVSTPQDTGQFDISTTNGKEKASHFLKSFLNLPYDETPHLYEASPHRFTDVSVDSTALMNAVSIINLDSVLAFSKAIGQEVDPRRFRGNILLSGMQAFSELDLLDQHIVIGDARLKVVQRTKRCPATQVDLETGKRNIKTPKLLLEHYGHMDMGVYAEVINGGVISQQDVVTIS